MALFGKSLLVFLGMFLGNVVLTMSGRSSMVEDKVHAGDFDVKPGGELLSLEEHLKPFACTFTYAAQGGTNEKWKFSLSHSADEREFVCTVERPGGRSYLFFQQFKMEVFGANVEDVVIQGDPDTALQPEEYTKDRSSVNDVAGKFSSQLSRVSVYAVRPRPEL